MTDKSYPGGKAGDGVYQAIINQIPPHDVYIEPFLGAGAILRHKKPAAVNIGIDLDANQIERMQGAVPAAQLICTDALIYLARINLAMHPRTFVYCDPPYPMSVRSSGRMLYQFEMATDTEHRSLLEVLKSLNCMVMLSGYDNDLYNDNLPGWRTITFPAMTRGGTQRMEKLWMNYPEPTELHDYRYLGADYRERERIKKKKNRWRAKLQAMPDLERYALLSTIQELWE